MRYVKKIIIINTVILKFKLSCQLVNTKNIKTLFSVRNENEESSRGNSRGSKFTRNLKKPSKKQIHYFHKELGNFILLSKLAFKLKYYIPENLSSIVT